MYACACTVRRIACKRLVSTLENLKIEKPVSSLCFHKFSLCRYNPALIPRWLDEQGPVLMTSSKFFGGPSFGSGVFFPHAAVDRMNEHLEVGGCSSDCLPAVYPVHKPNPEDP
jgi:hypothetical protein